MNPETRRMLAWALVVLVFALTPRPASRRSDGLTCDRCRHPSSTRSRHVHDIGDGLPTITMLCHNCERIEAR